MNDKISGRFAIIALITVAGIAAYVSADHIVRLGLAFRQPIDVAAPQPAVIDGLVLACSMHLYRSAKRGERGIKLASFGLWTGVLATLAANVGFGVRQDIGHGPVAVTVGALWSGMPAFAFLITAEVSILAARRGARSAWRTTAEPVATPPATPVSKVAAPVSGRKRGTEPPEFPAAVAAYRASLTDGPALSERKLALEHLGGNRHMARRAILAAQNGAAQ